MTQVKTLMFYINTIHDGGAERVILQLAHHFAQVGYRSILITSFIDNNEYPVPQDVERISIEKVEIQQSRIKRNYSRIIKLRKICEEYNPIALISFMAEPNFRAMLATIGLPTKNIVSVRNDPKREYNGKLGHFIGKHIITHADGCVFQTEEAKRWFPSDFQNKSKVIFNDVDRIFFETPYIGGNDIVTLGRLSKQKNQTMLIRAFAQISEKIKDCNLLVYGIGQLEPELKKLIAELRLESRVKLMGLTADAPTALSKARIFVLSSDFEGMPNALMEALAIGVPSISTDCPCGGPKTLINSEHNGILVKVNDEDAMAEAMLRLIQDSAFANVLGKNAKIEANKYRTEKVFKEWKEYVEQIINT